MALQPTPILYRYETSPFCRKIENILLLKGISHKRVNVPPVLPRPVITETFGLNYRRVPILTIGNDIYCDSSLIIPVLERRFPASRSIFPSRKGGGGPDKGLIRAFSKYFVDDAMLPAAVPLYPWENLDISVVNDRTKFMGKGPDIVGEMLGKRGKGMADLDAQLTLVEEQIEDGREWLFDTERPGLADVAVYWVCAWCKEFGASVLHINEGKFPYTLKWFERMRDCIEAEGTQNGNALWEDVDGDAAGKEAAAAQCEMHEFDQQIAKYLGVQKEQTVSVAPVGDGLSYNAKDYSTIGKLVSLDKEELCVEIEGKLGKFRCHFPRLGYNVYSL